MLLAVGDSTSLVYRHSVAKELGATEVAPVWWTPQHLAKEVSRCRNHIRLTRRSSGARWSSWYERDVIRPNELSREFGCSSNSIRKWVRQSDLDAGRREDGLSTDEREELRRVRRENRQLREAHESLKKAAPWVRTEDRFDTTEVFELMRANQALHQVRTMCGVGSLPQRVLRLARARAISTREGGRGTQGEDCGHPQTLARDVWSATGACAAHG